MFTKKLALAAVAAVAVSAGFAGAANAQARDNIRIVGSSTVYPFSSTVAEHFGKMGKFKTPVVESTGTGGGFKLFCAGIGPAFPDIANASRPITTGEKESCAKNGVADVTEIVIGYDGIAVAERIDAKKFDLTLAQLWQAVAAKVVVNGKIVDNPYKKWSDIDKSFPDGEIMVYGPAPNHGTRDAFVELGMDIGCDAFPEVKALPKDEKKKVCQTVREDGAWIDNPEDYALIDSKLKSDKDAVGVYTFSYIDQARDRIRAKKINGIEAGFETISNLKYPLSRPLFFYVKNAHLKTIPGMKEFVAEFLSEKAAGDGGYLADKGLIPLPKAELEKQVQAASKM